MPVLTGLDAVPPAARWSKTNAPARPPLSPEDLEKCFPTGGRDPEADDLDYLAAILHALGYHCCREPFLVEVGEHLGLEPLRQHDRCGDTASPSVGEQGESAAPFRAEARFSRRCRHVGSIGRRLHSFNVAVQPVRLCRTFPAALKNQPAEIRLAAGTDAIGGCWRGLHLRGSCCPPGRPYGSRPLRRASILAL